MRAPPVLGWLTLFALVHGLLWATLVPPWQTPDEPKHFEYVRLLAEGDRLVAFATEAEAADPELQEDILRSMDAHRFWWYGRAPGYDPDHPPRRFADVWTGGSHTAFYRSSPAYYWLAARLQPADRLAGLYVARLLSVVLGALVAFLAGWAARELFPDEPLVRYGAPAFVAFLPMFAFVHAGVTNDALANFLAALAFLLVARLLARGASAARLLLLGIVVVAAVLTKRTAVPVALMALVALGLWPTTRARRPLAALGAVVAISLGMAVAGWLWWAGGGLAVAPEAWRATALRYFFNEPDQPERIAAFLRAPDVGAVLVQFAWAMHNSFWGSFGWQIIDLPAGLYAALGLVSAVAIAGAAVRIVARRTAPEARAALVASLAGIAVAVGAACAFFLSYLDQPFPPPPQGRYLFAVIAPVALVFTAGLGAWVPDRHQGRALAVFILVMAAFDLVALAGFVVPFFYGA